MSDLNESHLALARITDALFCSNVETGGSLTRSQVGQAVNDAMRKHRDWNGLTRTVRAAFVETPVEAAWREEWCRRVAQGVLNSTDEVPDFSRSLG